MAMFSIGKAVCLLCSFSEIRGPPRFQQMIDGVKSDNRDLQLSETLKIQILLGQPDPPIIPIVEAGLVPCFVQFLSNDDFSELKYASAFVLAKITLGTSQNIMVLIDSGAVPLFVHLLSSDREEDQLLALYALGNIASNSVHCRDHVLTCGAMPYLLALINEDSTSEMCISASLTLLQLCRRFPRPPEADQALPVLKFLLNSNIDLVLQNSSKLLNHLTYQHTLDVIDLIPRLIQLISHELMCIVKPILSCIKNAAMMNELTVHELINHQVLPILLNLLKTTDSEYIMMQICLIMTFIATMNVQEVIEAGFMPPMIHLLHDPNTKTHAVVMILAVTEAGSYDQINWLVSQGCIEPMCDLLTCGDPRGISATLDALQEILEAGEYEKNLGNTGDDNLNAKMIIDVGGKTNFF